MKRPYLAALCSLITLALSQCIQQQSDFGNYKGLKMAPYTVRGQHYTPMSVEAALHYDAVGLASHYDGAGGITAIGEHPVRGDFYAAHKTLPLPCVARLSCIETGRSCVVRVNDRGPFIAGRLVDVSEEVAEYLGFGNRGLKHLRIQVLSVGDGPYKRMAQKP